MVVNKYSIPVLSLLWTISLYFVVFSLKRPNTISLLELKGKCACAADYDVANITGNFHSALDMIYKIAVVGFILVFVFTRGQPLWIKAILFASWFGLFVLANPLIR